MGHDEQQAVAIIVGVLIYFVVLGIPIMQILNKAGYSRAWILILIIPIVNIIMLWVFAFSKWPSLTQAQAQPYGYAPQQGYPPQGYAPHYPQQGHPGGHHYPPQQPPYQPPPR